ncbi:hypothetical protein ACFWA6_05550 [Streptomyces sp. NPDC060020]|uniref:hypothetical protein n=1 Tax=Streptomyces sp. NPDC060020 TaxID=3347038 RepID=UPI0036783E15
MRKLFLSAVATATGIALMPLGAASASPRADIGSVVCQGGSLTFQANPGIGFNAATVELSASGDLGLCSSPERPRITGGTVRIKATARAQCPGPVRAIGAKVTISWNDGSTSVSERSFLFGDMQAYNLDGGEVTTGAFTGGHASASGRTTTPVQEIGAACITSGVISYTATVDHFSVGE